MAAKRFSQKYATFEEWFTYTKSKTDYKERIRKAVLAHPNIFIDLDQARGHTGNKKKGLSQLPPTPISSLPVEVRTPHQTQKVLDSRSVYWDMRNDGISLKEASSRYGISPRTVLRNLDAFVKPRDRWLPKKTFSSPIEMHVVAEGKDHVLTIVSSEDASLIGRHHSAIKAFTESGDKGHLRPFHRMRVKDVSGRYWTLETDPDALYHILEGREDEEYYSIYKE
jgi:hypothetical protein